MNFHEHLQAASKLSKGCVIISIEIDETGHPRAIGLVSKGKDLEVLGALTYLDTKLDDMKDSIMDNFNKTSSTSEKNTSRIEDILKSSDIDIKTMSMEELDKKMEETVKFARTVTTFSVPYLKDMPLKMKQDLAILIYHIKDMVSKSSIEDSMESFFKAHTMRDDLYEDVKKWAHENGLSSEWHEAFDGDDTSNNFDINDISF